jgi:hypothetical protein
VHVAVRVHHVALAEDALEAAVHHRAPEHLSELRDRGPNVVPQAGADHLAALLPFPLGIRVQRAVNLRRHVVNLQRQEALPDKLGHLLVREQPRLAVQARAGVWQLRQRDRIAPRHRQRAQVASDASEASPRRLLSRAHHSSDRARPRLGRVPAAPPPRPRFDSLCGEASRICRRAGRLRTKA